MTITGLNPGTRYSGVVILDYTGDLAGQVAKATLGKSVAKQTTEVLGLIDASLASAGITKSKLLGVNIFPSDISKLSQRNTDCDNWVDKTNMPVRVMVEEKIASPLKNTEIFCIVALKRFGFSLKSQASEFKHFWFEF